jgi:hypothetical protein
LRQSLLILILPFAAACGEDAGIAGVWSGATASSIAFQFTLVETPQGAVSGVGVIANGIATTPANVTGAHAHPALSLTITFPQTQIAPISYQGTFSPDLMSIRGILNGSGFGTGLVRDSLILNRTTPSARITGP